MPYKDPAKLKEYRRAYHAEWYAKNKESVLARTAKSNRVYKERNMEIANEFKSAPCADCGVSYPPYVLDFDHLGDDKLDNVSRLVGSKASEEAIRSEIAKCEVVCSNCHRERTHERWLRTKLYPVAG